MHDRVTAIEILLIAISRYCNGNPRAAEGIRAEEHRIIVRVNIQCRISYLRRHDANASVCVCYGSGENIAKSRCCSVTRYKIPMCLPQMSSRQSSARHVNIQRDLPVGIFGFYRNGEQKQRRFEIVYETKIEIEDCGTKIEMMSAIRIEMRNSIEIRIKPTWLQHENQPAQLVRYHTLTKYRREVTASAVVFHPVRETSDDPLPLHRISIPIREASKALVTRLESKETKVADALCHCKELKWRWAGHIAWLTDNIWTHRLTSRVGQIRL
ncbi:hypothetical protein EVAR_66781_1 [Eumeta japonica]|uniref:Uncharacterized protein n=1 Tax=Eumeta variegata TaxID=151549 RepID=A0A4C1ZK79_EUMVA|nr:hypothetical protein EVAR_66781_1 [Eumeta japonica]